MKRIVFVLVAVLICSALAAQDLLVKRNGEKMRVKVLSVTKRKVKFVRQGTEMPVYTLRASDIDYIEYPMGDRDSFATDGTLQNTPAMTKESVRIAAQETEAKAAEPKKWHGAVVAYGAPQPPQPARDITDKSLPQYSVGDLYTNGDVKGIVVTTTDNGRHGTIMSLDEECLAWCTIKPKLLKRVGADSHIDGRENMKAVAAHIAANNLSWSDFPAFKWCLDKGDGWYLPALNEVWALGTMYNGGSRTAASHKARKAFNARLKGAEGVLISNIMYYSSSTENRDVKLNHHSHMNSETPYTGTSYKGEELFVRAFYRF